jgi:hypothetical protein
MVHRVLYHTAESRNAYNILVERPQRKRLLRRPRVDGGLF